MDASSNSERVNEELKRVADLPATSLVSEEDVKNKVVLPMLRALGYDDSDFNYERRTGRGYVDIVVERFPSGIVVEAKAPRTPLDQYKQQLETYVFHKHGQDKTTLAILTDGERFNFYGVNGPLWKGGLDKYLVVSFKRADLKNRIFAGELNQLLGRESNQEGAIRDALESYKQSRKERFEEIHAELTKLKDERQRIEASIQELEAELKMNKEPEAPTTVSPSKSIPGETADFPAAPHILRLLDDRGAYSRTQAVDRKWLDDQLVHRVDGVKTHQAVSFGLIKLKGDGRIEYEGKPIRKVWLRQKGSGT
jgi:predicted type IV restriction endonuclease